MSSLWHRTSSVMIVVAIVFTALAGAQLLSAYDDVADVLVAQDTSGLPAPSSVPPPSTPPPSPTSVPSTEASPSETASTAPSSSPPPAPTEAANPTAARLEQLLAQVSRVESRPNPPGYDRDCGPGGGCVFGPEWNDATDAPDSHNGCDTRNDVLRRDLTNVVIDSGTNGCVVRRGVLHDPYTGRTIAFERGWGSSLAVQVDHLIPLAAAWDLGAWEWTPAERATFANDTDHELLAVDGPTNMSKGDSTPASWLPPNKAFRCQYGVLYLEASLHWGLPITAADAEVLGHVVRKCR